MKNLNNLIWIFLILLFTVSCENNEMPSEEEVDATGEFSSMQDGLITLKSGVVVEKKGDTFYWQGDMMLSQKQLETLDEHGDYIIEEPEYISTDTIFHPVYNIPMSLIAGNTVVPRAFGLNPTPYNMWAMVRFVYASNLTNYHKTVIKQALQHWEAKTNIRFYNATGEDTEHPVYGFEYPYVEFFLHPSKNNSYVGRIGGRQRINIKNWRKSVVIHEIGHAIGLRHEQSRYNRDNCININLSNVLSKHRSNFNKYTTNYFAVGSIDYNSVMMYDSYGFAINRTIPVMTKKSDGSTWTGGTVLSSLDRKWANRLYIPYIARSDVYRELATTVYKSDNTITTASERLTYQAQLNNWNSTPPSGGRIPNDF